MNRLAQLALVLLAAVPAYSQDPDTFTNVERIVAIGDLHADYARFTAVLRQAALIDTANHWTGAKTHLVLCGDLIDRGSNSAQVLDLIIALEPEALKAGGRVHALLGNHEAMNMLGDLRYVTADDYAAYRTPDSVRAQANQMQSVLNQLTLSGTPPADTAAWKRQFLAEHPLGWVERSLAFLPTGKYGKWLLRHNAIVKINDAIFLHGGISAKYVKRSLKSINESVRSELAAGQSSANSILTSEDGPLWYRGLMLDNESNATTNQLVSRILEEFGVRHIVVGHTPNPVILPRFNSRVIGIDVGLATVMGGPLAYLLIEGDKYVAVHQGRPIPIPTDAAGVLGYLTSAAALDPPGSRLRVMLDNRKAGK